MLQEFAVDFTPPQEGLDGATGLYAGEQDLFCFSDRPHGVDGDWRRKLHRFLRLELGGRPKEPRYLDILVSGHLPEPYRLGRR